jgi:chromosome segregation ATPase
MGGGVPKLDFKRLKKVQEFKDWYTYASKLEDSVKYLRQRIKQIEDDNTVLNSKFRKEQASKDSLFSLNEKLNKALNRANVKIAEIKDKYKQKVSKKCYYCNNDLEVSMNLNTTLD